jgi:hypothetical protein
METKAFVDACVEVGKTFNLGFCRREFVLGAELLIEFLVSFLLSVTVASEVVEDCAS